MKLNVALTKNTIEIYSHKGSDVLNDNKGRSVRIRPQTTHHREQTHALPPFTYCALMLKSITGHIVDQYGLHRRCCRCILNLYRDVMTHSLRHIVKNNSI